jgi:hypothetical protein
MTLRTTDRSEATTKRGICLPIVALLVLSLSVSLATRVFHLNLNVSASAAVYPSASQAVRQHMDRDALHWAPPVPNLAVLQAPSFYPRIAPAGSPVVALFHEILYNRPPPSNSFV